MKTMISVKEKEDTEKIINFIASLDKNEKKSFFDFIRGFELARSTNEIRKERGKKEC